VASAIGLTEQNIQNAAESLGCDTASIKAVEQIESGGSGFLTDGRLRVLFEGHVFYRYTKGAFALTHPKLCYPKWTKVYYCKGDSETRGICELDRLEEAKTLDKTAAVMSCSIGRYQVMGFNFALCGFKTIEELWAALNISETEHLKAFCSYVKALGIDDDLRKHDWAGFARRYNGPEYKRNRYDTKLANAYGRHLARAVTA
jgi:hypothetical protein